MIHSVLIFNNDGLARLVKFYSSVSIHQQQQLLQQVHSLVKDRNDNQSSFLTIPPILQDLAGDHGNEIKIIYRHYATLYFVFIVDKKESELGILDLIQVFVQVLNRCFKDVCELDLVFHWQVLEIALEEMIQGGMVIDTNINKIVKSIDELNKEDITTSSGSLTEDLNRSSFFNRWGISR